MNCISTKSSETMRKLHERFDCWNDDDGRTEEDSTVAAAAAAVATWSEVTLEKNELWDEEDVEE